MSFPVLSYISDLLQRFAMAIDITEAQYLAVIEKYNEVARHLAAQDSLLFPYKPDIKPQGSFLLGTMIRPVVANDELDVDLVCRLHGKNESWTQKDVKRAVGDQLKTYESYSRMIDTEGNRCWTLTDRNTANFHMDILPAIVGVNHFTVLDKTFSASRRSQLAQLAVRITDKRSIVYNSQPNPQQWPESNPFGYAVWFRERANTITSRSFPLSNAIEPLPGYEKDKEPLARVVQILKRHRDVMFAGDPSKPISIIITTLAANAYQKEKDLLLAVNSILKRMETFIEVRYSPEHGSMVKWVSNPVNDKENFADKWLEGKEGAQKESRFYEWLQKARTDFDKLGQLGITQAYLHCKTLLRTDAKVHTNSVSIKKIDF